MVLARWRRTVRGATALAAGCAALAPLACGGTDAQPATARAALATALAAFDRGDAGELCDSLSSAGRRVIGHAMHGRAPLQCERDVRPFLRLIGRYRSDATVARIARRGAGRAAATLRLPDGTAVAIPLRLEDGSWRLDGLFDASLSRIQVRGEPAERSRFLERRPAALGRGDVAVRDLTAAGRPRCPALSLADYPRVKGGCLLTTAPAVGRLSLRTAFGAMRFAQCEISYRLRVDGSGRAWIADLDIAGTNPCFDALPCWDSRRRVVPWPARIERDGRAGLRLRIEDVCVDTCVGRFEGRWDIALVERRRAWRLRSASTVGASGWRFDVAVRSEGKPIAIER